MSSPGFVTDRHEHLAGVDRAAFSPDRTYRYGPFRRWGDGPTLCWVMLNPSTADAFREDATSRRVRSFTRRLGRYGGLVIVNLYSLRSTDPRNLWTHPDPIGPLGDKFLMEQAGCRTSVIAAWGTHGARNNRGQLVADKLAACGVTLHCLGVTGNGQPRHPLYTRADTPLQPYQARQVSMHAGGGHD